MAHQEEAKCKLPVPAIPAKVVEYHRELHGVMEGVPEDVRPANLVKTAKVSFRQSLHPHKKRSPTSQACAGSDQPRKISAKKSTIACQERWSAAALYFAPGMLSASTPESVKACTAWP